MANKKETQEPTDGVLVAAAKTIGLAAGSIAAAVGMTAPQKQKVPKLVNKNKSRLPRRQKKATKKAVTGTKRAGKVTAKG
ncbi:MAG: hypothetical protein ABJC09_00050 [Terriglobia bacterium]